MSVLRAWLGLPLPLWERVPSGERARRVSSRVPEVAPLARPRAARASTSPSRGEGRSERAMMAMAHPKLALRPFLPADAAAAARNLPRQHRGADRRRLHRGAAGAWASAADDEAAFGKKLAGELTLVATLEGSPVGFASLEGKDKIDMLYVHPAAAGQGVGAMLVDALEKLAGGRGAGKLTVDASDTARGFFEKRGYVAQQRNTVTVGDEWLANTTLQQATRRKGAPHEQARHAVPAPLALLHRAQIRVLAAAVALALYVAYRLV